MTDSSMTDTDRTDADADRTDADANRIVEFTGERTAEAPLTWGQQALWAAALRTWPQDNYFNYSREHHLPENTSFAAIETALAAVFNRHESLRTRLTSRDQVPTQRVEAAGKLEYQVVDIVEAGEEAIADAVTRIRDQYDATAYDYIEEWPVRVTVVTRGGAPVRLVLGFCHLASDFQGSAVVLGDFAAALADPRTPLPEAAQAIDLAQRQHGPDGERTNKAALKFWEDGFRRMPASMFPTPIAEPENPRYRVAQLHSFAMHDAVNQIAARLALPSAGVLTAACSAVVAGLGGHDTSAMLVIAGNRLRSERRRLVSSISAEGLLVTELDPAGGFDALVRRHWQEGLRMFKRSEYDETGREEVIARVSRERGEPIHPYCCYNDLRTEADRGAHPDTVGERTGAAPHTLLDRSEFEWIGTEEKVSCRFCLHLFGAGLIPGRFDIQLTADTAYLPPAVIEQYLRAVELLLVEAADGDVPLAALDRLLAAAHPAGRG